MGGGRGWGEGEGGVIQVLASILHQAFYNSCSVLQQSQAKLFMVYIMDLVKLVCISKVSTKSLRTS